MQFPWTNGYGSPPHKPVFATYVIVATLMILKAVSMSWLTVVRMMQVQGSFRSPEDIKKRNSMQSNPTYTPPARCGRADQCYLLSAGRGFSNMPIMGPTGSRLGPRLSPDAGGRRHPRTARCRTSPYPETGARTP